MGQLKDTMIRNLKAPEKAKKYYDSDGLYLLHTPANGKLWRLDYNFGGKRKTYSFGSYPAVTLAEARCLRDECKRLLAAGEDPMAVRKSEKQRREKEEQEKILTYRYVAEDWFQTKQSGNRPRTAQACRSRLEKHVLSKIGEKLYKDVTLNDLRSILRELESEEKFEMSRRISFIMNAIGEHAEINGWSEQNVARTIKRLVQKRPAGDKRPLPAITDKFGVAEMLKKIDAYVASNKASVYMCSALLLYPLLGLRGTELIAATWDEIDFTAKTLIIPADRMKIKTKDHVIYLSEQALAIFENLRKYRTSNFIFPSYSESGHLTIEGVNKTLHLAGIPKGNHCNHGWRKSLSTLAHSEHVPHELIETTLSHNIGNEASRAYNLATYERDMKYFWQWWSDYLYALKEGKETPKWNLEY